MIGLGDTYGDIDVLPVLCSTRTLLRPPKAGRCRSWADRNPTLEIHSSIVGQAKLTTEHVILIILASGMSVRGPEDRPPNLGQLAPTPVAPPLRKIVSSCLRLGPPVCAQAVGLLTDNLVLILAAFFISPLMTVRAAAVDPLAKAATIPVGCLQLLLTAAAAEHLPPSR
eukprot:SAG22_NODE_52_length_24288_cov_15.594568_2_plen_169_part_00